MNIVEASNHLFEWYSENDSINAKTDFKKVFPDSKQTEENLACFIAALEEMEKTDLIKSKNDYWILMRPFDSYEQTLKLPPAVALSVAHLVNGFCNIVGNESDYCNMAEIRPQDIENVVVICTHLLNEKSEDSP